MNRRFGSILAIRRLAAILLSLFVAYLVVHESFGYSTHPGAHVALSTLLLDLALVKTYRINVITVASAAVLSGYGLFVIKHGGDPFELKVACWYGITTVFILLTDYSSKRKVIFR